MRGAIILGSPTAKRKTVLITENSRGKLEGVLNSKNEVERFLVYRIDPNNPFHMVSEFDSDQFQSAVDSLK